MRHLSKLFFNILRKFNEAKVSESPEATVWGSGTPLGQFMHCDDLANALLFLLKAYSGYDAKIIWDKTKLDGIPRKLMDTSNLYKMGWKSNRTLFDGIRHTYENWLAK